MTQQLIVDLEYDENRGLVPTLDALTSETGVFWQILFPANRAHRWPLVKFQAWDERRMNALIDSLATVNGDAPLKQRLQAKVTSF